MKITIPCGASEEDDTYKNEVALIEDADFTVEEEFKVADYKLEHVKNEYLDIFKTTEMANIHLIRSAFNWRTFRSTIFGVTWKPTFFFLVFYFFFQTLYQYEYFSTCRDLTNSTESIEPEAEAAKCNRMWHDFVASMVESEASAIKYLTFILGFYVGQMIKRWWDQVKSLPDIDSITNCLAGFVQLEFQNEQKTQDNALRLRKKVVRYCLLAWTMCLASISPPLQDKFSSGQKYIEKRLLRKGELKALQGDKSEDERSWMTQWWIPISWAISLVNSNHPDSQGCKLKEQKDIISNLNKFHTKLHTVCLYQNNPLPLIYGQALFLAIHSWIILSIFSSQSLDIENSLWFLVFSFPMFQIVKIILIYGWMKTANIVRNPFGWDKNYDINLEELLDHNIWKASLSIRHLDRPIYTF